MGASPFVDGVNAPSALFSGRLRRTYREETIVIQLLFHVNP
jgi:hypothetical protein